MLNSQLIIITGGIENSKEVTKIFNCNCIKPKKYPDLLYEVLDYDLLKLNDIVFCIGRRSLADEPEFHNIVFEIKLNDTNLEWSDVVSINEKRGLLGASVLCDHLVVAGGGNRKDCLSSIEYFDGGRKVTSFWTPSGAFGSFLKNPSKRRTILREHVPNDRIRPPRREASNRYRAMQTRGVGKTDPYLRNKDWLSRWASHKEPPTRRDASRSSGG